MKLGEMPHNRIYLGMKCPHCGSGTTVIEEYKKSREPVCMMCSRSLPIEAVNEFLRRKG